MTVGTGMGLNVNVLPSAGGNLPCDATQGCTDTSYGSVRFLDGATVLGTAAVTANFNTAPAQFRASLSWIPTTTGARTITAQYLGTTRSEEHTSELQSQSNLVCRLLLEKKKSTVTWTRPYI